MLTTKRDKKVCQKYSARDDQGFVHCYECPLRRGYELQCKANSHYNRKTKEWEYDEEDCQ